MMQIKSKPRKKIAGESMSRTGVDFREAHNAARDAVAEMREMTIKYGRPLAGRYLDDRQRGKRRA